MARAIDLSAFYAFLYRRGWLAFLLLGASFVLFGVASLNLFVVFRAAWEFLVRHGWDAVQEGVLLQLAELIISGYVAVAFYWLLKVCERVLVDRVCESKRKSNP